jgi:hypothetical protein
MKTAHTMLTRSCTIVVPAAWLILRPSSKVVAFLGEPLVKKLLGGEDKVSDTLWVAGAFLGIGAAVAVGKVMFEYMLDSIRRTMTMSVEFDSRDESFRWVLEWLADNRGANQVSATTHICASFAGCYNGHPHSAVTMSRRSTRAKLLMWELHHREKYNTPQLPALTGSLQMRVIGCC